MIFIINNNSMRFFFLLIFIVVGFSGCEVPGCMDSSAINYDSSATDDDGSCMYPPSQECVGSDNNCIEINFYHFVDDVEIIFSNDNIVYENSAGNNYSVRRILYVLSDIMLFFEDGTTLLLDEFIFVNTDDPNTLTKTIYDLPALCVGISFSLGLSSENNIDNQYIDSPNNFHSYMLWPNLNGTNPAFQGGYHYMKIEGKYLNSIGDQSFYNTHTGPTNAINFSSIHSFTFNANQLISINMNINNWYNNPIYDFNIFGSAIMSNIEAQDNLYQNASDVFSIQLN